MHPQRPPISLNVAAAVADAMGVVDGVDSEDAVDSVGTVETVELEIVTKVGAPIAKLTVTLQMPAGNENAP